MPNLGGDGPLLLFASSGWLFSLEDLAMRRGCLLGIAALTAALCGCTMCANPYDNYYGLYGGSWQRVEPCQGRVGSRFANAGVPVLTPQVETLPMPEAPQTTDEPAAPRTTPPPRTPSQYTDPINARPLPGNSSARSVLPRR
jgi:hypothetical protein